MDQRVENKLELKDRIIHFFNNNKIKIYIFIFILIVSLILFFFIKVNNEKKNILVSQKYVEAGLYLSSNKKDSAKKVYEEIILSNNKIYSILALNTIIEKDLISDKKKILEYFENLEKAISIKNQKDLILFKKGLYLIRNSDVQIGNNLLKKLIDEDSSLKTLAQEILQK